jgi:hypothetical protein
MLHVRRSTADYVAMLYSLACSALSTHTAGVGLGANQGHAGGLDLYVRFIRPHQIIHAHAKRLG